MLSEISKSTLIFLKFIFYQRETRSGMHNFLVRKTIVWVPCMRIIGYKAVHIGNTLDSRRIQMRSRLRMKLIDNQVIESFD